MERNIRDPEDRAFVQHADAVYEKCVEPYLKPEDKGKFVALDLDSGDYELDTDDLTAMDRLRDRHPGVIAWLVRVGSPYVDRFELAELSSAET